MVKNNIMAELIKNGIQISEIFSEKPDLEQVFVKLINAPDKKNSLEELLSEMPDESEKSEEDNE
jgi:ABC-2 type transport system ATP-binding protein